MNKLIAVSLVAALSGVFGAPQTVSARDNEVAAAVGGFIGGLIVGNSLDRHRGHYDDDRVVRVRGRVVIESGRNHHHGYWEWTTVRVWVPGYWMVRYDDRGRRDRHYVRGYYENRRERVRVSECDYEYCDRGCR